MIRRTVLSVLVCASMGQVAHATLYKINTFVDENGENASKCSLREAIEASKLKRPYGGCVAGERFFTDEIVLEKGTYQLVHGELLPNSDPGLRIYGATSVDQNLDDEVTGKKPGRIATSSVIVAAPNARIFNTALARSGFSLFDVTLSGGSARNGGSIRNGGGITLTRVTIENATASENGGAIYLEGIGASLTAIDSIFKGNNAGSGAAVVGMSCFDNLGLSGRSVSFTRSSLINNGSSSANSTIDVCGEASVSLIASTVAKNTTSNLPTSAILRMSDDGAGNRLGGGGRLELLSATVTENNSSATVGYDDSANFSMNSSVLAYNQGMDCAYRGVLSQEDFAKRRSVGYSNSLIGGQFISDETARFITTNCQFPRNNTSNTTQASNRNQYQNGSVLSDVYFPLGNYGGFTQGYLPKDNSANTDAVNAVDKGALITQCGDFDQRAVSRTSGIKAGALNTATDTKCDIGAFELSKLTANDDNGLGNQAYNVVVDEEATTLTQAEQNALSAEDKILLARIKKELAEKQAAYKATFKFRRAYISVFNNDIAQELVTVNNGVASSKVVPLTNRDYSVTVTSLGTGANLVDGNAFGLGNVVPAPNAADIECQWIGDVFEKNANGSNGKFLGALNQVAIWRKDGSITPSGDYERCLYQITYKDGKTSKGVVQARINNVAPITKEDTFTLPFGSKQISLDVLANDSDDGDGPVGAFGTPASRKVFFFQEGRPLAEQVNIRIKKQPSLGELVFERTAPCPDNSPSRPETTCHGGKVTYIADNLFSKFNDDFTYEVLDGDRTASSETKVFVINTATTTDKDKAGGGAVGVWSVLGLLGLMVYRRRRVTR